MGDESGYIVVAVGTWMYDGTVPREVQLLARPARFSASRWVENQQNGRFEVDENTPIPTTSDGYVYYVGATGGSEFLSLAEAIAWADRQPWGPVKWSFRDK